MQRIVKAHTPLLPEQLKFRTLQGEETLSQLFEFEVELVSPTHSLDFKPLLGKPLTLEIETALGQPPRLLNGQITQCVLVGRESGTSRHYVYRVTLRPWFWYLTQTSDSKIFQNQTVPEILEEVLADYPFPVEFKLNETYRQWEYCVQYQETDFAFVSRLMEHEGIYYWFRHEQGKHTLVLTDDIARHPMLPGNETIPYYSPDRVTVPQKEYVSGWEVAERITPGAFATTDYNFHTPDALLEAQRNNPGSYEHSGFEMYEWLGGYTDANQAEHYTRVRLQDLQCRQQQVGGVCNVRAMAPGYRFALRNHARQAENREYLVVGARYHVREGGYASGSGDEGLFEVAFTVLPSSVQFRAPRVTPVPRTHGPQTARVVGKPGEQIWTDGYGRVKVQFHWDRYGRRNEHSSCWVRVSSPWASNAFGAIQLPRVNDEVVVDFIAGHPDRPLIVGRVYNASNMPPWNLPANATQSGFLSRTRDGTPHTANAFMFEDKPGEEEIWLHAEKDQRIEVENDESHWIGRDRSKKVDRDESDKIGRNWKLSTGGYKFETVRLTSVQNVGLGGMLNVGMAYNVNVGGLHLRNVGLEMASTVGRDRHDRVVQSWTSDVGKDYTVTVRGKAVGDAVKKDNEKELEVSPVFPSPLPEPVSSSDANQLRMTDGGETSLSGAKEALLIGPGGTVTIDESGIRLRGKGIYLEAPVISMTGGDANPLVPVTEADCADCRNKTVSEHPVDVATGQKVLGHADFVLPGRVPIRWSRSYRSADQRAGALGVAWRLPYSTELRTGPAGLIYFDGDGRQLQFPALEAGQEHFHPVEKYTLVRGEDTAAGPAYAVRFGNGVEEHYAPHPRDGGRWQLQRITTRSGQSLALAYTGDGALREVRNNMHTVRCTLDEAGRVVAVHRHGPRTGAGLAEPLRLASYAYDEQGDLVAATDRHGRVWRYQYAHHLLTEYRTPSGAVHVSQWDGDTPQARCVRTYAYDPQERGADGRPSITRDTRFAYSPAARTTRVTDGLGQVTEYHYNGLWAVERVLHPDGSIALTHFDETGSVAGHTDELGRTVRKVNDAHGHPTTIIDPTGLVTRVAYDDRGLPVQVTDAAGQVWQNAYDDAGNLLSETDPLGNTTTYEYADGLLACRRDALGNETRMQYDAAGQLTALTDCSGNVTRYGYDELGQLDEVTDAAGRSNRYSWNDAGQMEASHHAGLGAWRASYDQASRPVVHTDPLGRVTRTHWNAFDQPVQAIDPAGTESGFEYDALGRVVRLTNAKGEATTFSYDSRGRVAEQTGFDGRRQSFRYNAANELVGRVDHGQDGQLETHLVYDSFGRLIERQSADGSRASYRYDPRGLLIQAQAVAPGQPASQVTYEYDAAGRCTAELQSHHGRVWRLAHALDAIGKRESTHIPQAGTLAWQRYGSGHVHGMLLDQEPLAAFERDVLHREVARTQGSVLHQWHYGPSGLLAAHDWQNLDGHGRPTGELRPWRTWRYDEAGQLTTLRDTYRGSRIYRYDPLARLIAMGREAPGQGSRHDVFHYDADGNMLAAASAVGTWPAAMAPMAPAGGDRLAAFLPVDAEAPVRYAYDGHGNRIERFVPLGAAAGLPTAPGGPDGSLSADGDAVAVADTQVSALEAREAADASGPAVVPQAAPVGDAVTRYRFDANHQLTAIEHADGSRTEYRYDALGRRIAKMHSPAGQSVRTTLFVWDGNWMVQEVRQGAGAHDEQRITYVAHPDGLGPLARIVDGRILHYVLDHLGTPQEIYDDSRQVVWAAEHSAYGKVERLLVAQEDNPLRFPGQYFDAESGLHYNRFRYYDAEAGRYINQDPVGLRGGANHYAYVRANPVQRRDPLGLVEWTGTGYQVSGGVVSGVNYSLRSECIDGQRALVEIYAGGGTASRGLEVAAQGFNASFTDQLDHIDPNVFHGQYSEYGIGASFFKGIGLGRTFLGDARSSSLVTIYNRGHGAGAGFSSGISRVTSSRMEPCRPRCVECENQSAETPTQPSYVPSTPPVTIPPNFMNQMFGAGF